MLTTNIMTPKTALDRPLTRPSSEFSTVSVMLALFMTTVTPRASAMMNAAPMKSPMPPTIPPTMPSSPRPPIRPTTIEATRNSAASSGKYQYQVIVLSRSLSPSAKSPHGMTEKIIRTKVNAKTHITVFCRPVISGGTDVGLQPQVLVARLRVRERLRRVAP